MTRDRLREWRELCEWLEAQRFNASYDVRVHRHLLVTSANTPAHRFGRNAHQAARRTEDERWRLDLLWWSTGHGWRLRKDYLAKLEAYERTLDAHEAALQLPLAVSA